MKLVFEMRFFPHLEQMCYMLLHSFTDTCVVLCRVELQKMKIVRPPAEVARYTMVFHKRDSGNEINKDRSVNVETVKMYYACFSILHGMHPDLCCSFNLFN